MPHRVHTSKILMGALLVGAPVLSRAATPAERATKPAPAKPAPVLPNASSWPYQWAEDELETNWSWRGDIGGRGTYETRVICGTHGANGKLSGLVVQIAGTGHGLQLQVWNQTEGKGAAVSQPIALSGSEGEISLQGTGNRLWVLWNGERLLETRANLAHAVLGYGSMGIANFRPGAMQPTEPVVFRDDFMRAQGPDEQELPGEWKVQGLWKTSGTLGPKSDAALNPNPFVFRASTFQETKQPAESVAIAGKWFWSQYSITVSVRPVLSDPDQPLVVGLEAYRQTNGNALRAEVDFRSGLAVLKQGNRVLAKSRPFNADPDQWHKLRLEPGPGAVSLTMDGMELLSAKCLLAQGVAALVSRTGGQNYIDFDDVRIGAHSQDDQWGETPLPDRFQKDRLMQFWASNARAWKRDLRGTWWHSGDFFGSAAVELDLPDYKTGEGLAILRADEAGKVFSTFSIAREADGQWAWKWERDGQTLAGKAPSGAQALRVADYAARLGEQQLFQRTPAHLQTAALKATKVGLRPTRNGNALPLPQLEKVDLQSGSFERDGRAVIGVNITPVTPEIAKDLGLTDSAGAIVDAIEANSPAARAGVKVGDVIRIVEDKQISDVESLRAAVGARKPGENVKFSVLRRPQDASGLEWEGVRVSTPRMLDYSFTSAPVDWHSTKGVWQVAERWTCSPQWSFFGGKNDANPTLWSRFAATGDWTLEAYLATPMDLARGERSPVDLNVTVGGDGKDLASGYSFLFGAKNRTVNQIRRGDAVAWEKPFELPAGAGDTHQDWFYVRLERRQTPAGVRFRYSVNGRNIGEYTDPKPLENKGHFAFWTVNGGISMARMRLWHSGVTAGEAPWLSNPNPIRTAGASSKSGNGTSGAAHVQLAALTAAPAKPNGPLSNDLGSWAPRVEGRRPAAILAPTANGLTITNPQSGGDWTAYLTKTTFDARLHPQLQFEYSLSPDVKINLYVKVDGQWREVIFSGNPRFGEAGDGQSLGRIEGVKADGQFHRAEFDLLAALRRKGIDGEAAKVEAVAFAAPDVDYLRAGLGGNHLGDSYQIRNLRAPILMR